MLRTLLVRENVSHCDFPSNVTFAAVNSQCCEASDIRCTDVIGNENYTGIEVAKLVAMSKGKWLNFKIAIGGHGGEGRGGGLCPS